MVGPGDAFPRILRGTLDKHDREKPSPIACKTAEDKLPQAPSDLSSPSSWQGKAPAEFPVSSPPTAHVRSELAAPCAAMVRLFVRRHSSCKFVCEDANPPAHASQPRKLLPRGLPIWAPNFVASPALISGFILPFPCSMRRCEVLI